MKSSTKQSRQDETKLRDVLRVKPIAAALSGLLLASGSAIAQQQTTEPKPDTIVVTGIRHAIETAIAAKRNSDSVVEVVTAEDIGKLPESSIADSLARLPGVTGQRGSDGRTNIISIRGLSPAFSGALLNGREIVSSSNTRAAEYDQFPSELVSSALVYKTPDATLIGQGMSGTVDIKTLRPLDLRGRQLVVNVHADRNSNNTPVSGGGSTTGKRVSVSYVNQFADNTLGVSLGFAHLDAPTQTINYTAQDVGSPDSWLGYTPVGLPRAVNGGGFAAHPMRFEVAAETRKNIRDGFMGTVEFRPNKDFRSQLDLYYSEFTAKSVKADFLADLYSVSWSGTPARRPMWSNVQTTQVGGNTVAISGHLENAAPLIENNASERKDKITAIGWNGELRLNDKWSALTDLSFSRNTHVEKNYLAYAGPYANGDFALTGFDFVAPGGNPNGQIRIAPAAGYNLTDPGQVKLGDVLGYVDTARHNLGWAGVERNPTSTDEIKSIRLTAKRAMGGIFSSLSVGANYTQRDKLIKSSVVDLYLTKDSAGNFIRTVPSAYQRTPSDLSASGVPGILTFDVLGLVNSGFYREQETLWNKTASDSSVHEKVTTAYGMLDIDTDLGNVLVRGNAGLQVVRTNQRSEGWIWYGDSLSTDLTKLSKLTGGKSYTDTLPSLNLVFDWRNDLITRFGLARTLARPGINDLRAGATAPKLNPIAPGSNIGVWNSGGPAGNPELDPWRANSVDLSLEKYFGKHSYIAAAVFQKKLLTYIFTQKIRRDFSDVPHDPALTPRENYAFVSGPANGHGGNIAGIELSASLEGKLLSPMLDGFGLVASATKTNSSIHANDDLTQPLEGLSGITNSVTVYYEKHGFSARINQTYRSPFLALSRDLYGNEARTKTGAEQLINLQLGYAFDAGYYKGLSLSMQVSNLTDRPLVTYSSAAFDVPDKVTLLPSQINKFGRQIGVTVGYKF